MKLKTFLLITKAFAVPMILFLCLAVIGPFMISSKSYVMMALGFITTFSGLLVSIKWSIDVAKALMIQHYKESLIDEDL